MTLLPILFFVAHCTALVARNPSKHGNTSLQSYNMPLTRNLDTGFFGTISVGTPAQKLTAFVDWTWISMWVISTTCDGGKEDISMCRAPQQIVFNQSMSSTFENVSTLYPSRTWNPSEFFGPYDFTVDYGSDIETIGPVSSRVVIQTSDIEPGLFTNTVFPFEGILGLSPVFPSDNRMTIMQQPFHRRLTPLQHPLNLPSTSSGRLGSGPAPTLRSSIATKNRRHSATAPTASKPLADMTRTSHADLPGTPSSVSRK